MQDEDKTKEQLITELHESRERIAELENDKGTDITERKRAEEVLKEGERKFRAIFDQTFQFMGLLDIDGRLIEANRTALQFAGVQESDVIGKLFWETPWWTHSTELQEMLRSAAKKGAAGGFVRFETNHPSIDGSLHCMDFSLKPVMDEAGGIVFLIAEARDINERKRAEERLKEYEKVVEGLEEMIAVVDLDYRYLIANCAFLSHRDMGRGQVVGRVVTEILDKKIFENDIKQKLDECFQGKVIKYEMKYHYPKFGDRDLLISYFPIEGPTGVDRVACVMQDITERKRAEEALRDSETRLRAITDSARDAILMMDQEGMITYWNPAAELILGYTREETTGQNLHRLLAPQRYHATYHAAFPRFVKTGRGEATGKTFELMARRKDGEEIPVELSLSAVFMEGWHAVGLLRDITERKHVEEEKKKLEAQLLQAQKMEAIGTLAGGIAHDFNNILQPIIGYTEMELNKLSPHDPMREGLKRVLNSSLRARELVKQILAVSRSTHDQQKTPVAISSIIKEALKLLRSTLPTSIEIRQNVQMGVALADPTQIYQVLMNLCTNASHAMDDKGILEIRLSPVDLSESDLADQSIIDLRPGPHLKLSVSDTGAGMDAQTIERIFDPYFTTKEVGKGSGLGLSVVHGIVKRHDGAITVKSEPGKGTAFSVYIPRVDVQSETTMIVDDPLPRGSERILLVDDEQAVVEMGTAILERLGYKVTTETDSLRALEVFSARPEEFDLIITDYTMPNLTGVDLAKEVRLIRPDMLILICTGFSERITPDSLKELGLELLMKPYGMRQISEAVRKILDARKGGGFEKGN